MPIAASLAIPTKGHVETFQTYDEPYYDIYLDGEFQDRFAKESPAPYLLSRTVHKSLAAQSGVDVQDLRFSFSRPCFQALSAGQDQGEASYEEMVEWRTRFPDPFAFQAVDIDELEQKIAAGGI